MKRSTRYWIAGAGVAVIGLGAAAGIASANRGWHHGHHGGGVSAMLERYDANKDGKLSQDEIDQNRTQWHGEFDKDKTGDLSIAEFEPLWLKARREEMVREYQEFDRDGDGKVTLDEYKQPMVAMVARMDRDGDGLLSPDDRRRWRKPATEQDDDKTDD